MKIWYNINVGNLTKLKTVNADGSYSSKFTEKQISDLKELDAQIQYNKKIAQDSIDFKVNTQDTKEQFEKL